MARRHSPLLVQILSFLLGTLLAVALDTLANSLANSTGGLPWGLEFLRRQSLPLAGGTVVLIIGVMIWQHRTEPRPVLPARQVWDSDRSPFPGLDAFTEQDSVVFFGRDAEIAQLLDRLHPVVAGQAHRLITVVGPSGVGKSSLVQAGVVPQLRQRRSGWIIVPPMVPGDHPRRSLARALSAACPEHYGEEEEEVPAPRFADELRKAARRPNAPVLIIADQAEELFTLSGAVERTAFLDLLASALADPRLWILLIMRSEFLTGFLRTAQARLFRDPVTVGTLNHAALVEVIEQPARQAGLIFDPPSLPQRMAVEAGGGDALPLLAYALQELYWAVGPGKPMTAVAYERIGGVTGVLTRQADKAATELGGTDPTGPVLATLLKFVTIGEDEPTRRRVRRSTLTEDQRGVVEAFLAARLLTSDTDRDDAIIQVAHEALFRSWAPLRQAIEASTDQLRWRADLERWAKDWEGSGRQDAYLLRDKRLKAAQRRAADDGGVMAGLTLVAEFLDCSNQADRATMQRLSETLARQALGTMDSDPEYGVLLALTAFEECAPSALAVRALTAALAVSFVRLVLRGHEDEVWEVAWSPDGKRLATASGDHTARIWDAVHGNELGILRGHEHWIWGVAWSPDGRRLATASNDRTARIWDAERGNELAILRGQDEVWGVAWSPDGRRLATTSTDRTARIWDADQGNELAILRGHDGVVRGLAWSPDGRRLATTSIDRTARIWNADSGSELVVLRGHKGFVRGVAWSPNGQLLATASEDRTIRVWDTRGNNELAALYGHSGWVQAVAWSPSGRCLATGSVDGTARIWDADSGSELVSLRGHQDRIRGVAWSSDGRQLATASDDRTARTWDVNTGRELAALHGHHHSVCGIAWSPDGQLLATASADWTIRIWDVNKGRELTALHGHHEWVLAVAWSPDGRRLATGSDDLTARIWDADNGLELTALRGHNDPVRAVAWSPDGRRLATGSRDRTARIWDADSSGEVALLHGHNGEIRGLAWSSDGQRIVTGSYDRTVRIWDCESGAEIVIVGEHPDGVESVAWSPDGRQVASASQDGTCRIWDATIRTGDLVDHAHRRISRRLTTEERRNLMLPPPD